MVHIQIDVLGEVVEAVEGRVEVYLDGGVRQGTDVLKALALGAKAVFIGRPVLWGLTYQVQYHQTDMLAVYTVYMYSSYSVTVYLCIYKMYIITNTLFLWTPKVGSTRVE